MIISDVDKIKEFSLIRVNKVTYAMIMPASNPPSIFTFLGIDNNLALHLQYVGVN